MSKKEKLHEAVWQKFDRGELLISEVRWVIIKINWRIEERS